MTLSHDWPLAAAAFAFGLEAAAGAWLTLTPPPEDFEAGVARAAARLTAACKNQGFTGPALEIDNVEGPYRDPALETLAPRLNELLTSAFEALHPPAARRKAALERVRALVKDREWIGELPNLSQTRPEIFLSAEWRWAGPPGAIALTLRAVRLNGTAETLTASERLLHPETARRRHRARTATAAAAAGGLPPALALSLWTILRRRREAAKETP